MHKIRVLVVDDSTVVRRLLTDALSGDPALEVIGTAPNGKIALAKLTQLQPDVVTLDIEMPEMDGLTTLGHLRKTHPRLPVIMFSTLTERGAEATLSALALGASDYVAKPANVGSVMAAIQSVREQLIPRIKGLCAAPGVPPSPRGAPMRTSVSDGPRPTIGARPLAREPGRINLLTIGVSTGGPNALAEILPKLPADLPVPVLITQHMPPLFTRHLAERLDKSSAISVREATDGELLRPGQVLIAPGDYHLTLARHGLDTRVRLTQDPPENSCRPAVDVMFRHAVEAYGSGVLAVVLTGMGQDGMRGAERVAWAGGWVIAQDEATSVVWGMPGAVVRAGVAHEVLPLSQIAPCVTAAIVRRRLATLTAR